MLNKRNEVTDDMNISELIETEINAISDKHLRKFVVNELLFELHCFIKEKEKEFNSTMEFFENYKKKTVNS